jgi:hypothetical protein
MPFIKTQTNVKISDKQESELKSMLGKAIELVPGKSEEYLFLKFEDKAHLWLKGDNSEPIAYIEVAIFGNESHAGYDRFTAVVTKAVSDILGIEPDHVYLKFEDITAWAVSGMYIDRRALG